MRKSDLAGARAEWESDRAWGPAALVGAIAGPVVLVIALSLAAWGAVELSSGSRRDIILLFGINAILVVGLQSFVGSTGIMSFGHVAFMGIGAYAAGIVAVPSAAKELLLPDLPTALQGIQLDLIPAVLVGGLAAVVFALLTGPMMLRLSGTAAAIMTFGLLVIVNDLLRNADAFTRGSQTFSGVPYRATVVAVFGTLLAVTALSALYKWTSPGLKARAVRDDAPGAEAAGVWPGGTRISAFVLSAFITGVGGALWAHLVTAYSPNSFFVAQTISIIAMLILGGVASVAGALIGATVMTVALELLRNVESGFSLGSLDVSPVRGITQLLLGASLILLLRWRSAGIAGQRELSFVFGRPRKFAGSTVRGETDPRESR